MSKFLQEKKINYACLSIYIVYAILLGMQAGTPRYAQVWCVGSKMQKS